MEDHTARPRQQRQTLGARPRIERCRVGDRMIPVTITQGAGDGLEYSARCEVAGRVYQVRSAIERTPGKHLQNVVAQQLAQQLSDHIDAERGQGGLAQGDKTD